MMRLNIWRSNRSQQDTNRTQKRLKQEPATAPAESEGRERKQTIVKQKVEGLGLVKQKQTCKQTKKNKKWLY